MRIILLSKLAVVEKGASLIFLADTKTKHREDWTGKTHCHRSDSLSGKLLELHETCQGKQLSFEDDLARSTRSSGRALCRM